MNVHFTSAYPESGCPSLTGSGFGSKMEELFMGPKLGDVVDSTQGETNNLISLYQSDQARTYGEFTVKLTCVGLDCASGRPPRSRFEPSAQNLMWWLVDLGFNRHYCDITESPWPADLDANLYRSLVDFYFNRHVKTALACWDFLGDVSMFGENADRDLKKVRTKERVIDLQTSTIFESQKALAPREHLIEVRVRLGNNKKILLMFRLFREFKPLSVMALMGRTAHNGMDEQAHAGLAANDRAMKIIVGGNGQRDIPEFLKEYIETHDHNIEGVMKRIQDAVSLQN